MPNTVDDASRRPALVVLTNFLAPYRLPVMERLAQLVPGMQMWVSAKSESDRDWARVSTQAFPVRQLKGLTLNRRAIGLSGQDLHVPVAALPELMRTGPAAVLTSEMGFRTLSAALYARMRPTSRLVVWATLSERTERSRSSRRQAVRRFLLRQADAVVVNGPSGKRYVRSLSLTVPVYVVHQATPARTSEAHQRSRPANEVGTADLNLLFVGQLIERKGLGQGLRALGDWSRSSGRSIRIDVVGSGPLHAELVAISESIDVDVNFLGTFSYEETQKQYESYDALFFPSLEDEWGLVVNEALQAGIPVLGSPHAQAVTCLIEPGVNGAIFDPENPVTAAPALDQLTALLDGDRDRLIQACQAVTEVASVELMAQGLSDAINGRFDALGGSPN